MKKRLLSLFMAFTMALSAAPMMAYAAGNEALQAANALNEIGLFQGTGTNPDGSPIYDLDRAPTRHEAVTMLVRLLGKTEEAKAGKWDMPFKDVASWAKPFVGYAYANGLASGTSATTFGGEQLVTAPQYLTFVLRALGYESGVDFQWKTAWELSDELGITSGQYNGETAFTRGDTAIISNNAMSAVFKGTEGTLRDMLMETDAVKDYMAGKALNGAWKEVLISTGLLDYGREFERYHIFSGSNYTTISVDLVDEKLHEVEIEKGEYSVKNGKITFSPNEKVETGWTYINEFQSVFEYYSKDNKNLTDTVIEFELKDDELKYGSNMANKYFIAEPVSASAEEIQKYYRHVNARTNLELTYLNGKVNTYPKKYGRSTDSSVYKDLAGQVFRSIKREYPSAIPQCAYVYAFKNEEGDLCVLTDVRYKIRTNWDEFTLHNITDGTKITDPDDYYDRLADRYYGASKIKYWDMANEIRGHHIKMMQAMSSVLKGGSNTYGGVFVDKATLGL